ncbi:MAG: acetate--CoA ligase family protein [Pirellulaceae bacterium]|nr:acetate--CoA ligase family protein [Pirellulaceae bacterium]
MTHRLDAVFRPRSLVVIGASRDRQSMSGSLLHNLKQSFTGPLYVVHPSAAEVDGVPTRASVPELPDALDLAFIAVPARLVLPVARQCVEKKFRALVVISAGFSETGPAGRELEQQLLELARRAGVPLVGPNCLGMLNTDPHHAVNGTFSLPQPPAGNVAVGTQSGALGFVFPDYIRPWRIGISQLLSTGNKCDVGENDLLEFWRDDPQTQVIQLYLESFQQPREFLRLARQVSLDKPILMLKAGRTSAGQRAAGSHTAALAGPDQVAQGLLKQAGVIRAASLEELFETTALLATQPLPRGRRVAILTNAGGPGVVCADALEAAGLSVPELSPGLQERLRAPLPPAASVKNPVDLIGSTDPRHFADCLQALLPADELDAVVIIYVPRLPDTSDQIAQAVIDAGRPWAGKTVLSVFMQAEAAPTRLLDTDYRVPAFRFPEAAARALASAAARYEWLARPAGRLTRPAGMRLPEARRIVDQALASRSRGIAPQTDQPDKPEQPEPVQEPGFWLDPAATQRLVEACGLDVPEWYLAGGADEAIDAARRIGSAVVLKANSPTALHKASAGGVQLDLRGPAEIRLAYDLIRSAVPDTQGVLVQRYVPGGIEVLLGARRDESFGQVIGCGLGGTLVERLGRVGFRLHPLTDRDADELVDEQLAFLLNDERADGERSTLRQPLAPMRSALLCISCLLSEVPEFAELDLNPIKLLVDQRRACCVDARFHLAPGA